MHDGEIKKNEETIFRSHFKNSYTKIVNLVCVLENN